MDTNNHTPKDENEEYVGNIWGWNFSLVGLVIIVLLGAFMVYRHKTMNVPFNGWSPGQEQTTTPAKDSIGR